MNKKLTFYAVVTRADLDAMPVALEAQGDLDVLSDISREQYDVVLESAGWEGCRRADLDWVSVNYQGKPLFEALLKVDSDDRWVVWTLPGLLELKVNK